MSFDWREAWHFLNISCFWCEMCSVNVMYIVFLLFWSLNLVHLWAQEKIVIYMSSLLYFFAQLLHRMWENQLKMHKTCHLCQISSSLNRWRRYTQIRIFKICNTFGDLMTIWNFQNWDQRKFKTYFICSIKHTPTTFRMNFPRSIDRDEKRPSRFTFSNKKQFRF